MKNILLSKKYGVNPSLEVCFWCGEDVGVALLGKLPNDAEAPKRIVCNYDPCDKCIEHRKSGIFLFEVHGTPTGRWVILRESALKAMLNSEELLKDILAKRQAAMDPETWNALFPTPHEIP